ncbi:aminotransferase class I/II-fold pyridoxal phosphate-dependent enzyme, partial [Burkholderia pseudomallei]
VYLAYPNNPTGTLYPHEHVERINAAAAASLVVIDEPYQPFAQRRWLPRAAQFDTVVEMRTMSKLGLARIRLGYLDGLPAR